MRDLILATTSTYKIELLRQLRLPFESMDSEIDEKKTTGTPDEIARVLAHQKARSVFLKNTHATVIGADQVIALDNHIFSKPQTPEKAAEQLHLLSGKTHQLYCAVSVITKDFSETEIVKFDMKMRPLSSKEINDYIQIDHPIYCCGSYKIESFGISLFEDLIGPDYSAIIGLPLTRVRRLLASSGFFK